jgi:hypothetical protein
MKQHLCGRAWMGVAVLGLTLVATGSAVAQGPPPKTPPRATPPVATRPPAPGSGAIARRTVRASECRKEAAELGISGTRATTYIASCSQR